MFMLKALKGSFEFTLTVNGWLPNVIARDCEVRLFDSDMSVISTWVEQALPLFDSVWAVEVKR